MHRGIHSGRSRSTRSTTRRTGSSWAKMLTWRYSLHGTAEIFPHFGRLIAGLDEKIGRKKAARLFLPSHHGIPGMYMRRFEEPQAVVSLMVSPSHLPITRPWQAKSKLFRLSGADNSQPTRRALGASSMKLSMPPHSSPSKCKRMK
jgi:hypothetical protein